MSSNLLGQWQYYSSTLGSAKGLQESFFFKLPWHHYKYDSFLNYEKENAMTSAIITLKTNKK